MTLAYRDAGGKTEFPASGPGCQPQPHRFFVIYFAFPNNDNPPPEAPQRFPVAFVTSNIPFELVGPVGGARFGNVGEWAAVMPVPEAAMHEHGEAVLREYEVGAAGKVLPVEAEAQAHAMGYAADSEFGKPCRGRESQP